MDINTIKEGINTDIDAVTIKLPISITMTSLNSAPFEFIPSINENGCIILTPVSKDAEFIDASIDMSNDTDEKPTDIVETNDGLTTKKTSIIISASMLCETENQEASIFVDDIGQVVICPVSENNVFITASIDDSLNLVTEELQVVDYFGYKLVNNGDGWDVIDYLNNVVETGVATQAEAKIIVLQTELRSVESLVEDTRTSTDLTQEETPVPITPDVEAEVIEESIDVYKDIVIAITDDFTETHGAISCDTQEELNYCINLLKDHYENVSSVDEDSKHIIYYSNLIKD